MAKIKKFDIDKHHKKNMSVIPEGTQALVKIVKEEVKKTQAKDGKYLVFEMEVVKGEYKGRKIWVNINFDNPSEQAVDIALDELADITRACGYSKAQKDTEALHGIPMCCEIGIQKGKDGYKDKNVIRKYQHKDQAGKGKSDKNKKGGEKPPWEKEKSKKKKDKSKKKKK